MELNGKIHHKSFLSDKLGFNKTIFEENGELISLLKGHLINFKSHLPFFLRNQSIWRISRMGHSYICQRSFGQRHF